MNKSQRTLLFWGSAATALQLLGVLRLLWPGRTAVDAFQGIVGIICGTLIWMGVLEWFFVAAGRSRLFCLLAPIGPLATLFLLPQKHKTRSFSTSASMSSPLPMHHQVAGLFMTVCVIVACLWAGFQWLRRDEWPPKLSEKAVRKHETATFTRLQALVTAQERYREADWDGDGEREYAPFLVHLWRSVDQAGRPVEVHLLPRRFGIAMSRAWALDGYYFTDLRRRQVQSVSVQQGETQTSEDSFEYRDIDYSHDWAVSATPAEHGGTGVLSFIVDRTGRVFARAARSDLGAYPFKPEQSGWIELLDETALAALQDATAYSTS